MLFVLYTVTKRIRKYNPQSKHNFLLDFLESYTFLSLYPLASMILKRSLYDLLKFLLALKRYTLKITGGINCSVMSSYVIIYYCNEPANSLTVTVEAWTST